jgi:hypothetical protein
LGKIIIMKKKLIINKNQKQAMLVGGNKKFK